MEKREIYNQERSHLLSVKQSTHEQYDKAILTLSSGALGFSIAFIKDIVPAGHLVALPIIVWSWGLFGVSIFCTIISFDLSQRAVERHLEYAEEYYINGKEEFREKANPFVTATGVSNIVSGASFLVGIILTIVFASINITKENCIMAEKKEGTKVPMREGYVPPKLEKSPQDEPDIIKKGFVPSKLPKIDSGKESGGTGNSGGSAPTSNDSGKKE